MPETSPARPPNLTLALLFIAFTSAFLLVNVGGTLMSWTSLDLQEGLRKALDEPQLRDAGLSVDGMITALKVFAYVMIPVGVAGVVLAVYAMRGHRGSRIPLTILAALGAVLFLMTGFASVVGIVPGVLLGFSAVALWSPDARRWFAVKNGAPDPTRPDVTTRAPSTTRPPTSAPIQPPPSDVAGPDREQPTTSALPSDVDRPTEVSPPTSGQASGWPSYPGPQQPAAAFGQAGPPPGLPWQAPQKPSRPGSVWGAAITAGVSSLLVLGVGVILVLVGTVLRGTYRQAFEQDPEARRSLADAGISIDQLLDGFLVVGVVIGVLALLGILAALAYLLRWPGGLAFLCVMSAVAIASVITCVGLVVAVPAVVVLVLALRQNARDWSARRR